MPWPARDGPSRTLKYAAPLLAPFLPPLSSFYSSPAAWHCPQATLPPFLSPLPSRCKGRALIAGALDSGGSASLAALRKAALDCDLRKVPPSLSASTSAGSPCIAAHRQSPSIPPGLPASCSFPPPRPPRICRCLLPRRGRLLSRRTSTVLPRGPYRALWCCKWPLLMTSASLPAPRQSPAPAQVPPSSPLTDSQQMIVAPCGRGKCRWKGGGGRPMMSRPPSVPPPARRLQPIAHILDPRCLFLRVLDRRRVPTGTRGEIGRGAGKQGQGGKQGVGQQASEGEGEARGRADSLAGGSALGGRGVSGAAALFYFPRGASLMLEKATYGTVRGSGNGCRNPCRLWWSTVCTFRVHPSRAGRMLRFKLTDGSVTATCIEYQPIDGFSPAIAPGTKVQLKEKVQVRSQTSHDPLLSHPSASECRPHVPGPCFQFASIYYPRALPP